MAFFVMRSGAPGAELRSAPQIMRTPEQQSASELNGLARSDFSAERATLKGARLAQFNVTNLLALARQSCGMALEKLIPKDFQFAEASRSEDMNTSPGVDPRRRTRGATSARPGARATDFGRVVRPAGGLFSGGAK